jgi:DnaJ-class molecular chaperone
MEYKYYYKVLGVGKQATAQEIKSAYRGLARKFHPDLHPGDKKAEERFKEINEAYEVLGDQSKRKKYDELGANWEEILRNKDAARQYAAPGFEWGGTESFDLNDFFETFFGGGGRRGASGGWGPFTGHERTARQAGRGEIHGETVTAPVELTLEEAFHGTNRRLQLSVDHPCSRCHGTGVIAEQGRRSGRRHAETMTMITCPECNGRGAVRGEKTLDVKIPRGVTEGSRVRLAGMGGQAGGGGRPGDLYLEVHLRPHRWFQVDGHDLVCDLPIRDDEAVLGASVQVPTLEGRVSLKIPPGSQQGSRLRLKEKGLPHLHGSAHGAASGTSGGSRGDLYYTLKIVTPASPSEEERSLMQQLRRLREQQGDRADPRRELFS